MPKKRYNNKQQICASLLKLELLVKMIDPENIFQQKPARWKKSSSTGSAEIGITCDPEKADFRGEP